MTVEMTVLVSSDRENIDFHKIIIQAGSFLTEA